MKLSLLAPLLCLLLLSACENTPEAKRTYPLSPDGFLSASLSKNFALLGNFKGYAEFWQLKPKQLIHTWQHTDERNGVLYSAISDNEKYAITAEKESLAWWRISDGILMNVWYLPGIHSVSLSADGKFALIGLADKAIYYSLFHGKTRFAFPHKQAVTQVDISQSNQLAITGSMDYTAKLWNLKDGNLLYIWQHQSTLSNVAISPDDKYALTNEGLGSARLWRVQSGKLYKQLGNNLVTLTDSAFSDDSLFLATGHVASRIDLWDIKKGKRVEYWRPKKKDNWKPSAASILSVHFTNNNKEIISVASNGYLQFWKNTVKSHKIVDK